MSVALRGNLEDFGIADVFQLVGQQRKTGILEFTGTDGRRVQLRFDRGAVVSAAPADSRAHGSLGEMFVRCGFLTRDQVDALHAECEPSGQSLILEQRIHITAMDGFEPIVFETRFGRVQTSSVTAAGAASIRDTIR